jgi:hypothetical protein
MPLEKADSVVPGSTGGTGEFAGRIEFAFAGGKIVVRIGLRGTDLE